MARTVPSNNERQRLNLLRPFLGFFFLPQQPLRPVRRERAGSDSSSCILPVRLFTPTDMLWGALPPPKADVLREERGSRTCTESCPLRGGDTGLLLPCILSLGGLSAIASLYNGGGSSRSGKRSENPSSESRYLLVDPLYALSLALEEVAGVYIVVAGVYEEYRISEGLFVFVPWELDSRAASSALELLVLGSD
jgi:hypothetical protein